MYKAVKPFSKYRISSQFFFTYPQDEATESPKSDKFRTIKKGVPQ